MCSMHISNSTLNLSAHSPGLDNRVEQVADGVVVAEDLRFDAINLTGLLLDSLLELSERVLQRLQQLLGYLLLLLQALRARDGLLAPVLVLLAHAVNIVGHVVN